MHFADGKQCSCPSFIVKFCYNSKCQITVELVVFKTSGLSADLNWDKRIYWF